jgi:hypothetical protein
MNKNNALLILLAALAFILASCGKGDTTTESSLMDKFLEPEIERLPPNIANRSEQSHIKNIKAKTNEFNKVFNDTCSAEDRTKLAKIWLCRKASVIVFNRADNTQDANNEYIKCVGNDSVDVSQPCKTAFNALAGPLNAFTI